MACAAAACTLPQCTLEVLVKCRKGRTCTLTPRPYTETLEGVESLSDMLSSLFLHHHYLWVIVTSSMKLAEQRVTEKNRERFLLFSLVGVGARIDDHSLVAYHVSAGKMRLRRKIQSPWISMDSASWEGP